MKLFVTGTDTDIGKTAVTACLAAALSELAPTMALKPVASGVTPGTPGDDARLIAVAAGHKPASALVLEAPLSPHRAAEMEGLTPSLPMLVDWTQKWKAAHVLVEGVGGWRVPLGWDFEVRDFAIALGYPVLVVVPDKLGALNHALLTVESIVDAGLDVTAVILNGGGPWAVVPSNLEDLRRLLHVPVCVFPNLDLHNAKARRAAGAHLLDSGAFQER